MNTFEYILRVFGKFRQIFYSKIAIFGLKMAIFGVDGQFPEKPLDENFCFMAEMIRL